MVFDGRRTDCTTFLDTGFFFFIRLLIIYWSITGVADVCFPEFLFDGRSRTGYTTFLIPDFSHRLLII